MDDRDGPSGALLTTGIEGLDNVLGGGLAANRLYVIEGNPGSGKTTLALQFLLAGAARGERCLFVTLSESARELATAAASHGWSLQGIDILEIIASEESLKPDARYTLFHPSEVELSETTRQVLSEVQRITPARIVVDSLAELRLLAQDPLRYRRQVLALKQFFSRQQCTVLMVDDQSGDNADQQLHSIAHGVIVLGSSVTEYGPLRRRLWVAKMRARAFREGYHDLRIVAGGVQVFPRLVAAEHRTDQETGVVRCGLAGLDALLGGGLARGTSTLIVGPAGAGKSTVAAHYAAHVAANGEHAVMYLFDERLATFRERAIGLGLNIDPLIDSGYLAVRQLDAAELPPGEFAHTVRRAVEENGARLVVIDSLSGYLNAMPSERFLTLHLHELLTYLGQKDVTTLVVLAQHGYAAGAADVTIDASYLVDTVLLLRFFEGVGEVRHAISVIKKRTGRHERTIRELSFENGIAIGDPVREFRGVLSGTPQLVSPPAGQTP